MKLTLHNQQYDIEVGHKHFMRRLGFPSDYELSEHMKDMMTNAIDWYDDNGQPWLNTFEIDVEINDGKLYFDGSEITSQKIYKRFIKYNVDKAMIVIATAGENSDIKIKEIWEEMPDQSFFLDAYASCVTESIINFAATHTKEWASQNGKLSMSRYGPGYKGWDLDQQRILMGIIKTRQSSLPVRMTDSSLMYPLKSQIAVIGLRNNS